MSENHGKTEPFIDKRAVAELTGFSVGHIDRLVCSKSIPHYKVGASKKSPVKFRRAEVEKWMKGFQVEVA
jgi:excisionase family DNA binding protein